MDIKVLKFYFTGLSSSCHLLVGHPNMKLFITQCGLQSLEEAIFKNVPILAIPVVWDQHHNAHIVRSKEIGLFLNHHDMTKEEVYMSIEEIITNEK